MNRAAPRVAFQLWIVGFIVFFGAEVIHLEPTLRVVTQALYGIPLAAWAIWRLRGPHDRLDAAVLGLLVVYAVVCVLSRDRTESLGTLGIAAAYATWFLLLRRAGDVRDDVVLAIATGLTITLAFNAYLLVKEKATWFATVGAAPFEGRLTFPWESVNALPVLVLLVIPFLAWLPASRLRSVLACVVALSAVVVVPISLGRAGWLGLTVAGLVYASLHPMPRQAWARARGSRRAVVMVGAGVVAVVGIVVVGPRLITAIGESGRLLIWAQGLTMATNDPLTGSGPGTYSWARLDFSPAAANLLAVRLVHDVPLQTLIDGGLLLTLGLMGAALSWASEVRRLERVSGDRVAVACAVGFVAALTLDDFSYLPAITVVSLAIAAFLVPLEGSPTERIGWVAPLIVGVAVLAAVPSIVAVDVARVAAQDGRSAIVRGAHESGVEHFGAATRAHPENGGYWLGLGMAAAYAGRSDVALDAYAHAVAVSPGDARAYAGLAALDSDADRARLLSEAADRTLGDPQYAVRLGLALVESEQSEEATGAWGRAVALRPALLRMLPYGETHISLEAVATEAVARIHAEPRPAPEADLEALWDIALATDSLPGDAGMAWRAVEVARRGDLDRARELAQEAIADTAYQARGYQAAAAVAAFACDAEAERAALDRERLTAGAFEAAPTEPAIRREFVYREASLGPTQPPGAAPTIELERWPWPLVDRPACST